MKVVLPHTSCVLDCLHTGHDEQNPENVDLFNVQSFIEPIYSTENETTGRIVLKNACVTCTIQRYHFPAKKEVDDVLHDEQVSIHMSVLEDRLP